MSIIMSVNRVFNSCVSFCFLFLLIFDDGFVSYNNNNDNNDNNNIPYLYRITFQ